MMNFKYAYRYVLCILLFAAMPNIEVNAQASQALKSVGKWIGKKTVKEGTEEIAEQSAKAISKEMAQKTITKNAANAIHKSSTTITRKNLQDYATTNIGKTLTTKVGKELSESALKTVSKEFAQQIGKSTSKEAQELFIKKIGTESTQEIGELTAKKSLKESAEKTIAKKQAARAAARLTGDDALKALDNMPQIKKEIAQLQKQSPAYFTTDKLYVEQIGKTKLVGFEGTPSKIEILSNGTIRAKGGSTTKIGDMNSFLNNPMPNTKYETESGLLNFKTNEFGKTTYVECHSSELSKTVQRGKKLEKGNSTELVLKKGGRQGVHDSGHIQSNATGGLNESINLLPMKKNKNRGGRWANLERTEREAIAHGKDVFRKTYISYKPDGSYSIKVELKIDNKTITETFNNLF